MDRFSHSGPGPFAVAQAPEPGNVHTLRNEECKQRPPLGMTGTEVFSKNNNHKATAESKTSARLTSLF